MKKISYGLNVILLLLLFYFLGLIVTAKTDDHILQREKNRDKQLFNLQNYFGKNPVDSLSNTFPYNSYLDMGNYKSIQAIKNDLILLDSLNSDPINNRRILALTLTQKLSGRRANYFATYQPDSLLKLIQWAEPFYHYSEIDPDNKLFYEAIHEYWMSTVSNALGKFSYENTSLKYDFKFGYLQARLTEKKFNPDVKKTSSEKVVDNFIHNKWGHLFNASWDQTSGLQKALIIIFILITLYGYICIVQKIKNRKK